VTRATASGAWTLPLQAIDDVAQATSWLRFAAPDGVPLEPGHFFMLSPATPSGVIFLGRPFSIGDARDGTWHFLLRVLGRGTAWLRSLGPGAPVRVVGPLGRPFHRPRRATHRFVAGGVGLAPFFHLARVLRAEQPDARLELLYGERAHGSHAAFDPGEEALFDCVERFTDDGSHGTSGTVVDGAERLLGGAGASHAQDGVAWYACGPYPMLRALAVLLEARGVHGAQFSLEERMGCGFGVCQACVVPNRAAPPSRTGAPRWRLLCLDGPVVDPREVAW
jgi:dihydroorotate dehydrogenase electron transfer subunit